MIKRTPSSPNDSDALDLDDVITGIVRLPIAAGERVRLLKILYDVTDPEKAKNGQCIIEGPFRDELSRLFIQRHAEVRDQRTRAARLRDRNAAISDDLSHMSLSELEAEELERIVQDTRGDFDRLGQELDRFGKDLEREVEADVRTRSDAADIAAAREQLRTPPTQE